MKRFAVFSAIAALLLCLTTGAPVVVSAAKVPTPSSFGYSRELYKVDDWVGLMNCGNTATKFVYDLEQILYNVRDETLPRQKELLAALGSDYFYNDSTRFFLTSQQATYLLTLDATKATFADVFGRLLGGDKGEHHVGNPAVFDVIETEDKETLYVVTWNDQCRLRGAAPMDGGDKLIDSRKQVTCIKGKQQGTKADVMFIYDVVVSSRSSTALGKTTYNDAGLVIPRPQS